MKYCAPAAVLLIYFEFLAGKHSESSEKKTTHCFVLLWKNTFLTEIMCANCVLETNMLFCSETLVLVGTSRG